MRNLIKFILVGVIMFGLYVNHADAQVVINSATPDPTADGSAVLELQSTDMGFLVPKVTLTALNDASPISSTPPATGLLVYNTGGTIEEGFYFWDGSFWTEMINDKRLFAYEQFGELYEIISGGIPTEVALANGGAYTGWTTATQGTISTGITTDLTNAVADKMIISRYGLYSIHIALSIAGSQNQLATSTVFIVRDPGTGPVDIETRITVTSKMAGGGALISGSSIGVLELFPGDELDLRFKSDSNNETIDIYSINYIVTKVGE